jgi:hypothetical protein
LAAAGIYFVWYRVAESNMAPFGVDEHSFMGMVRKLQENVGTTVQLAVFNLSRPLGGVFRQLKAGGADALWSRIFWTDMLALAIYSYGFWWLLRERARELGIVYAWKICCYAPVMPLHDTWPWYEYMPHLVDYALPLLFLDVAWRRWGGAAARLPAAIGRLAPAFRRPDADGSTGRVKAIRG